MSIQILCRVIGRTSDHLEFADAVLKVCKLSLLPFRADYFAI